MEEKAEGAAESQPANIRTVADRVAARYAKAPTYSEMLTAEARNAARAAEAAAAAASEAREAAQAILIGLDAELEDRELEACRHGDIGEQTAKLEADDQPSKAVPAAPREDRPRPERPSLAVLEAEEEECLEEEAPVQPLPAKLLEFPRELVAARKARPRLAEGPLREEQDRASGHSQLRIFEVEAETISTDAGADPVLPGWSAIRLDSAPAVHSRAVEQRGGSGRREARKESLAGHSAEISAFELPLQTASIEDRLMAGIVDAALTMGGFLVFVLVFAACTAHLPSGKPAMIGAAAALFAFAAIYQLLFFTFGHDTPGMRYAKIALCTFEDENPTRQAARRRLGALLLAVCPLGLGIFWAFFDDDRLGWHDRISRTYQRSYR
jgi:uncharacterized RDD family membrane protein YckC